MPQGQSPDMLTTPEIFKRYEEVRYRMPKAHCLRSMRDIDDVNEITE